jgi:hypothetical protein
LSGTIHSRKTSRQEELTQKKLKIRNSPQKELINTYFTEKYFTAKFYQPDADTVHHKQHTTKNESKVGDYFSETTVHHRFSQKQLTVRIFPRRVRSS